MLVQRLPALSEWRWDIEAEGWMLYFIRTHGRSDWGQDQVGRQYGDLETNSPAPWFVHQWGESVVVNSKFTENKCLSLVEALIVNICELVWPSAPSGFQFTRLKSCLLGCSVAEADVSWEDSEGEISYQQAFDEGKNASSSSISPMAPFPKISQLFVFMTFESIMWSYLEIEKLLKAP